MRILLKVAALLAAGLVALRAQDSDGLAAIRKGQTLTASVRVSAFDTNGRFLGTPDIIRFEALDGGKSWTSKFRRGVADGIPYGTYRLEARLTAYYSDIRIVRVYQARVALLVGLTFGSELPVIPPTLSGRILGDLPRPAFVRLTSVYATIALDSAVDSDGHFELGGLTEGRYLLIVINSTGVMATRELTIPYAGPTLEIAIASQR